MNILLLGASGYLGRKLVQKLKKDGNRIIAATRENPLFDYGTLDLRQEDVWNINDIDTRFAEFSGKIDVFCNCACQYQSLEVQAKNADIIEANFYVPMKWLLHCVDFGVKNYITIGTGLPGDMSFYTKTKEQFADMLKWYVGINNDEERALHVCNVLLENYYGEGEPVERFIPGLIQKMKNNEDIYLTEGFQKRDFIYAGDVVNALIKTMDYLENYDKKSALYFDLPLGSGESVEIRELVNYLASLTKTQSTLHYGAIPMRRCEPNTKADLSKCRELGISIEYDWKRGMKRML